VQIAAPQVLAVEAEAQRSLAAFRLLVGGRTGFFHHPEAGFFQKAAFVKPALQNGCAGLLEENAIALTLAFRAQAFLNELFHQYPHSIIVFFNSLIDTISHFELFAGHFHTPLLVGFFVEEAVRLISPKPIADAAPGPTSLSKPAVLDFSILI
jgi:hypothetical protein